MLAWVLVGGAVGCSKPSGGPQAPSDSSTQGTQDPGATSQLDPDTATTPGGASESDATGSSESSRPPNILLFIADDLGVDVLGSSGFTKSPALTPNLDKLAASGLFFENFWVTPACTTTRGALISGQHGFASGIDFVPAVMPDETLTLQKRLKGSDIPTPYATGVFGKWHLGGPKADANHPNKFGVDQYAGNLFNLDNYSDWTITQNGQQTQIKDYHTTKVVDLARYFILGQPSDQPWFAWVAFAAPHSPFHAPPADLVTTTPNDNAPSQYKSMVESMDTEIGRLVDGLAPEVKKDTIIIFLGDNGTPPKARDREIFAQDHVKNSIYEGGIRAPMIISGAGVARSGERESAMINATDLYATLVQLASSADTPSEIPKHSVSFAQLLSKAGAAPRSFNYAEWKSGGELFWAVRDAGHKAIKFPDGSSQLFATSDISETNPVDDAAILDRLLKLGEDLRQGKIAP